MQKKIIFCPKIYNPENNLQFQLGEAKKNSKNPKKPLFLLASRRCQKQNLERKQRPTTSRIESDKEDTNWDSTERKKNKKGNTNKEEEEER